jgi:Xaa-Pro aminopeptidase
MFQSFDATSDPAQAAPRVARLRELLEEKGLDGFLVPRADEHQGEYVPASAERLKWLTGFTGSAGLALVLRDRAVLFVDGRYTLQARVQTDQDLFTIDSLVQNPPRKWLAANLGQGERIAFDPWLHTIDEAKSLRASVEKAGGELVATENLVDAIWDGRPPAPLEPVTIHDLRFAGETARDKLKRLQAAISEARAGCTVLTDPSSFAWTFNIRGADVAHTPLALGFAILGADGHHRLFIDHRKLPRETEAYLTQLADLLPPSALEDELRALAATGLKVGLDPSLAAEKLRLVVEQARGTFVAMPDPARLPRATKNEAELQGSRDAHRRDGAALVRFLAWLDAQPAGSVDEIAAVKRLEECRRQAGEASQMPLRDISFDTISGAGPNGAIIHYRVTTATNRTLDGELFLLDSGAQFEDGTTDITRTVAIGTPSDEMCERATLVLKGMIAISRLRFPAGTRGADIDVVARMELWRRGLDYGHGTGHGVGAFLSVHEGPQRIAKTGTAPLLPGMIVSNEPGYYKEGAYGIRLENLIVVEPARAIEGGDIDMHGFETLTLVPFDRRLITTELMTDDEVDWMDAYHARVHVEIGPLVDGEVLAWLDEATAPLR